MAGIYLHIPFCSRACTYCDFHFSTKMDTYPRVVNALLQELNQRSSELNGQGVESIYLGGGTPSLLKNKDLEEILNTIHRQFSVSPHAEITLEVNPEDVTPEKAHFWKAVGVNRLSMGIQSFHEKDLILMNRNHHSRESETAILEVQKAGLDNLTVDLIYGLPNASHEEWLYNVKKAIDMGVQHLSSYALTVEEKTVLAHQIKTKKLPPLDEELAQEQFFMLVDEVQKAGFRHYEISNMALPGYEALHNTNYWKGVPYLGIGPSAHSYDGVNRRWNVSNNIKYAAGIEAGTRYFEEEFLTDKDRFNERIMTGLRMDTGIDLEGLKSDFPENFTQFLLSEAQQDLTNNRLTLKNNHLKVTPENRFFADGIAANLFFI